MQRKKANVLSLRFLDEALFMLWVEVLVAADLGWRGHGLHGVIFGEFFIVAGVTKR